MQNDAAGITKLSDTFWRCAVLPIRKCMSLFRRAGAIILSMGLGLQPTVLVRPAEAHEDCAECIMQPTPVLSTPLEGFMGKMECGFNPIIASTAIKKSALSKLFSSWLSRSVPILNSTWKPVPLTPAPIDLLLPAPDQLNALMPLLAYASRYGGDVAKIADNMNEGDLQKLCEQENKKVCAAVVALRGIRLARQTAAHTKEKIKETLKNLREKCEAAGPVLSLILPGAGSNLCELIPTPGSSSNARQAQQQQEKEGQLTVFLKGLLVPYQLKQNRVSLDRLKYESISMQADPRQPGIYYASIAIDDIGLSGHAELSTKNPPPTSVISDGAWNVSMKPGRRTYATVALKTQLQADGTYHFTILPGTMNVKLNNEDFNVTTQTRDLSMVSQYTDQIVSTLSKDILSNHSNLISSKVSELVANNTSRGLTGLLDSKQNNLIIPHPLMPESVQRTVLNTMIEKEIGAWGQVEGFSTDLQAEVFRDRVVRSRAYLRNLKMILDASPDLAPDVQEDLKLYQAQLQRLKKQQEENGGDDLNWKQYLARILPIDYSKSRVELLDGLIKRTERLLDKTQALMQSGNAGSHSGTMASTQLRFFENPEHPDYLYMGAASCPQQGQYLDPSKKEFPIQFQNPRLAAGSKPDFSVAVDANAINNYLKIMFENGLLDASVTGSDSIRSVQFLKEPKIEIGENGKVTVSINAAFDSAGVPNLLTNNVDVKLDVELGLSPDQKSLAVKPLKTSVSLNVRDHKIQSYLSEWILKVPVNLFLPIAKPSNRQIGQQINDQARVPHVVTNYTKNLHLETSHGAVFLTGDIQ